MPRWMIVVLATAGLSVGCTQGGDTPAKTGDKAPASKAASSKAPASKAASSKAPASKAAPASTATSVAAPAEPPGVGLFAPLPERMESPKNPTTAAKIDLGRMLYFEKRISKNHDVSCNSCHNLATFGVDNNPKSPGHKGQLGGRNSPTTYNAAGHIAQFWDGRSPDVEDQAKGPVLAPVEMAMPSPEAVVAVLASMPGYVEAFKKAFPDDANPVTWDNYAKAVGSFERGLVTPSRWDAYLKGDKTLLTNLERKGFELFTATGCTACHNGAFIGGQLYAKLGAVKPWPNLTDEGRFEVTKKEADKYTFKAPSLRNIAKTGPYLHDGSIKDLKTMVKMMAEYQLGKTLAESDAEAIVAWLESLTGTPPAAYIKAPALPESTATTPKADPT